jgi:hypothetical protein
MGGIERYLVISQNSPLPIDDRNSITIANVTLQDIWIAAQRIYADHPELLEAVRQTLFGK